MNVHERDAIPKSGEAGGGWSEDYGRMSLALRAGRLVLWELDLESGQVTSTREFNEILGIPADSDFSLDQVRERFEDERFLDAAIERAVTGEDAFREETFVLTSPNGEKRSIHVRFAPVKGDGGGVVKVRGVATDVTDEMNARQKLTESEAKFRQLADMAPAIIWIGATTGELRYVNQRWLDYTGQSADAVLPGGWYGVFPDEDIKTLAQHSVTAVAEGKGFKTEARMRRHDGALRWHSVVVEPQRNLDGEIEAWIGVNTDIHDTKAENEAVRFQRDQLFHLARDAFGVFDRDGVLLSVNPAWTRILGWTQEELEGANLLSFLHPDDIGTAMAELSGYDNGNVEFVFENRVRGKDGNYRWISWTGVPNKWLFYAVGRDVTKEREAAASLHEAQEALRQSQKLEAVGLLTGGVAHDVNNALTAISSGVSLAESRIKNGRYEEALHFTGIARTSARRAAALTHRLLAFARRQELEVQPVNINELILSMESLLSQTMGEHVQVRLDLAQDLWIAKSDINQFENVLINLAINSRDAMPSGGSFGIETMNAYLDEAFVRNKEGLAPGNYILLSVTDSGKGMNAQELSNAFVPFWTSKPYGEGTGLGLPMVYGFVKQLGGYIALVSEPGRGTTVKIYMPQSTEELPTETNMSEVRPPRAKGESVLIVEDNPTVRKLACDILEQVGYRVLMAEDGQAGLEILRSSETIDLLLSDIMLPGGMNGREMAALAMRHRPDLRVLFVTGREDSAASDVGRTETILKPFSLFDLSVKVREMLDKP